MFIEAYTQWCVTDGAFDPNGSGDRVWIRGSTIVRIERGCYLADGKYISVLFANGDGGYCREFYHPETPERLVSLLMYERPSRVFVTGVTE